MDSHNEGLRREYITLSREEIETALRDYANQPDDPTASVEQNRRNRVLAVICWNLLQRQIAVTTVQRASVELMRDFMTEIQLEMAALHGAKNKR